MVLGFDFKKLPGANELAQGFARGLYGQKPETSHALSPEGAAAKYVFEMKATALNMAKEAAAKRGDGSKPTMTDYFIAALELGEARKEEMAAKGIQWNPKMMADLSGQSIDGFQINKADMQPRAEIQQMAMLRVMSGAHENGTQPGLIDVLHEMRRIQLSGEQIDNSPAAMGQVREGIEGLKAQGVRAFEDMMDLDGNGKLSFYEDIDRHEKWEKTVFSNVSFHPAGTIMRDDGNGVARADGASFDSVTFDGMGPNDVLSLARGNYKDIRLENISGGHIDIADGTQVHGMNVRGMHASLSIGRASVSGLDATDAHIIRLDAAPGALVSQATFNGATIDMASELKGSAWRNVRFTNANLTDVDMNGAELSHVHFTNCSLNHMSLTGARLNNVSFQGCDMDGVDFARVRFGENVTIDGVPVRSESDAAMAHKLGEVGSTLLSAMNSIKDGPVAAPAAAAPQVMASMQTTITGGDSVDFTQIGISTAVASQARTVPANEQASGVNMQPRNG